MTCGCVRPHLHGVALLAAETAVAIPSNPLPTRPDTFEEVVRYLPGRTAPWYINSAGARVKEQHAERDNAGAAKGLT